MPRQVVTEAIAREAVRLRDGGHTYRHIADELNFTSCSSARWAWRQGLTSQGRANEIPTRSIRVRHNGRVTTVTAPQLTGFTTLNALTIGIEFEVVGVGCYEASQAMSNAGMRCNDTGYNHRTMTCWKVVPDGSLNGSESCEMVSPHPLRGTDGMNEVRTVASILRAAGARVNRSCGMHIHIGVDGAFTQSEQANIIRMYQAWEPAFDALVTQERLVKNQEVYAVKRSKGSAEYLADRWTNTNDTKNLADHEERYHSLNVNAYFKYGTFEIRTHHGSTNGMNATAWLAFNTAFFMWAAFMWEEPQSLSTRSLATNSQGGITLRSEQILCCKELAQKLFDDNFITQELFDYIIMRAGNVRNTESGGN